MNGITTVGIDLAKNVFQLHAVDASGKAIWKKRLKREEMASFFAQLPASRVIMEACGGAHHWGRLFSKQGHDVQLIAAQYVKPFKKTVQKNDRNDAEAIVEAALRPSMKYVSVKSLRHQDLQSLHRVRQQLINARVMFVNQVRGLLMEYGIVIEEGFASYKRHIAEALEDANTELTPLVRDLLHSQDQMISKLCKDLAEVDGKLKSLTDEDEDCQRLMRVPGVGINGASLFIASVGNPTVFKNGRHVAAWLGLVPSQFSSGESQRLGRITKAGDCPLRAMLIHGARAHILSVLRKQLPDKRSVWVLKLLKEKGWNKATVAVANKNARIMLNIYKNKTDYKAA
jgi:transposase